jgi:hypothetical protein
MVLETAVSGRRQYFQFKFSNSLEDVFSAETQKRINFESRRL